MRGSIPRPGDHDLSRRERLNPLSHPGAKGVVLIMLIFCGAQQIQQGIPFLAPGPFWVFPLVLSPTATKVTQILKGKCINYPL